MISIKPRMMGNFGLPDALVIKTPANLGRRSHQVHPGGSVFKSKLVYWWTNGPLLKRQDGSNHVY